MPTRDDEDPLRKLWQVVRDKISEDAMDNRIGSRIGSYLLTKRLGQGGMGSVYQAQQYERLDREVALKLIKPGMDSTEVISRFNIERETLAKMNHPNIATILDAGEENGQPYFVMELVKEGTSITQYCNDEELDIKERLELFVLVCQAIQHAHQKPIIHRDIKPSNVLVTRYGKDEKPVPKIIDFGVARTEAC